MIIVASPAVPPSFPRLLLLLLLFLPLFLLLLLLLLAIHPAVAARQFAAARALQGQDGRTACAGCPNDGVRDCVATSETIGDAHCARCATGQAWWPCDLAEECHCRDPPAYDEDAVGATPAPDPTPGTGWPHPTILEGAAVGSQVSQGAPANGASIKKYERWPPRT
jgi:hypothetical protein